jgi:hypothetical protein
MNKTYKCRKEGYTAKFIWHFTLMPEPGNLLTKFLVSVKYEGNECFNAIYDINGKCDVLPYLLDEHQLEESDLDIIEKIDIPNKFSFENATKILESL